MFRDVGTANLNDDASSMKPIKNKDGLDHDTIILYTNLYFIVKHDE